MIEIENLNFHYPGSNFNLSVDSMSIEQGEKVALIGPSGYGKTTFLNLISGILTPDQGTVSIDGEVINNFSDTQKRVFRISNIGFVFQEFELVEYLSLKDNITFPYLINPAIKLTEEVENNLKYLADKFGLSDKMERNVNKLSQGEKQRVAICRAILSSPKILLADEPTGNLDPENKENTVNELISYSNENNALLIMVTHDFSLLDKFERKLDLRDFYKN